MSARFPVAAYEFSRKFPGYTADNVSFCTTTNRFHTQTSYSVCARADPRDPTLVYAAHRKGYSRGKLSADSNNKQQHLHTPSRPLLTTPTPRSLTIAGPAAPFLFDCVTIIPLRTLSIHAWPSCVHQPLTPPSCDHPFDSRLQCGPSNCVGGTWHSPSELSSSVVQYRVLG